MTCLACCCKINLFLEVGEREDSGLHSLFSLFLPLGAPADAIYIKIAPERSFRLNGNVPELCNSENLIFRAWDLYASITGFRPGLEVDLRKNIPWGAGLGGGSSNAASMLAWLNSINPEPLESECLAELASRLGSDVPFFLLRQPALVSGTGNKIRPFALPKEKYAIVLVWPEIHVSTGQAFKALDECRKREGLEKDLTKASGQNTKIFFAGNAQKSGNFFETFVNDLERPVFARWPELAAIKKSFLEAGAEHAAMSGSGSAIFGIFKDDNLARHTASRLGKNFRHVYLAHYDNTGV